MRAKLVYLEDTSVIDEDGILDEDDALKVTAWSKQKKTTFGKATCNYNGECKKPSILNLRIVNVDPDTSSPDIEEVFVEEALDLETPTAVATSDNFVQFKNGSQENKCNIIPIDLPSEVNIDTEEHDSEDCKETQFETSKDSIIIPFTLDIDINKFVSSNNTMEDEKSNFGEDVNLEKFLDQLSNILNINNTNSDVIMNGLCVSEGSSIIWIKFKNMTQEKLEDMIKEFLNSSQGTANKFKNKFKLNIHKTKDMVAKTMTKAKEKFHQKQKNGKKNTMTSTSGNKLQTQFDEWMNTHIDRLYPLIYDSIKSGHCDFKILDMMVVDVPERIKKFQEYDDFMDSKLLFHGTSTKHFASIINGGFIDRGSNSIGKWYGKGFYFTSYPAYALEYYAMKNGERDMITLIGSIVNTGNVREIAEKHMNEDIDKPYDSNHIRVFGTGPGKYHPAPIGKDEKVKIGAFCICGDELKLYTNSEECYSNDTKNNSKVQCNACDRILEEKNDKVYHCKRNSLNIDDHKNGYDLCFSCFDQRVAILSGKTTKFLSVADQVYDEYAVRDSSRIVPRYLVKLQKVDTLFVWRNTTFDKYPNAPIYEEIAKNNVVYVCKDSLSALKTIELKQRHCKKLFVISNAEDGQHFVGDLIIKDLNVASDRILIFTMSATWTKTWADPLGVQVTDSPRTVQEFVAKNGL